ncbi:unnamed protein product, partial [Amoebophrya sp. A120]
QDDAARTASTTAVVGTGRDLPYPEDHRWRRQQLAEGAGAAVILSPLVRHNSARNERKSEMLAINNPLLGTTTVEEQSKPPNRAGSHTALDQTGMDGDGEEFEYEEQDSETKGGGAHDVPRPQIPAFGFPAVTLQSENSEDPYPGGRGSSMVSYPDDGAHPEAYRSTLSYPASQNEQPEPAPAVDAANMDRAVELPQPSSITG